MLKVLVMLDCDECRRPLEHSTACSDRDPMVWQAASEELICDAMKQGWDFHQDRMRCAECNDPELRHPSQQSEHAVANVFN